MNSPKCLPHQIEWSFPAIPTATSRPYPLRKRHTQTDTLTHIKHKTAPARSKSERNEPESIPTRARCTQRSENPASRIIARMDTREIVYKTPCGGTARVSFRHHHHRPPDTHTQTHHLSTHPRTKTHTHKHIAWAIFVWHDSLVHFATRQPARTYLSIKEAPRTHSAYTSAAYTCAKYALSTCNTPCARSKHTYACMNRAHIDIRAHLYAHRVRSIPLRHSRCSSRSSVHKPPTKSPTHSHPPPTHKCCPCAA